MKIKFIGIRSVAFILSLLLVAPCMVGEAQLQGLDIEAPSEVFSGEQFKIVVTYDGEPAGNAQLTFEGAIMDPVKTSRNGVAIARAPNVTEPTKVTINVKYHGGVSTAYQYEYDSTTIMILPTKETREKGVKEKSQTLFEGKIVIAPNNVWYAKYGLDEGDTLLISIKTDGKSINEYVLNEDSYTQYQRRRTVSADDYYLFNVIEGDSFFSVPPSPKGEWYIVLENPHDTAVSVTVSISRYMPTS